MERHEWADEIIAYVSGHPVEWSFKKPVADNEWGLVKDLKVFECDWLKFRIKE